MKRLIAAFLLAASLVGTAAADDQRVRLRGTITAVDHDTVSLALATGPATILLTPSTRIAYLVKSDLSAIKPGMAVGVSAVPGPGGAVLAHSVNIFPANSTPTLGTGPWDSEPGATMTNAPVTTIADARVTSVGSHLLTLSLPTGDKQILVGPNTPIVTSAPADRAALVAGAHVIVYATKHDDGSYSVSALNVGQNGLTPPM